MTNLNPNQHINILIVDDEESVRTSLRDWFVEDGYTADMAASGKEALSKLAERDWDIFFLDIKMPGMDGLELQKKIKKINPESIIIIITAYASVDSAVEALKSGAYDYITKPFDPDYLENIINRATEKKKISKQNIEMKINLDKITTPKKIIGSCPSMNTVMELVDVVSKANSTVLIRGASGTGKELVARAIHANSNRRYAPFVAINCGALPEGILESELFGHEKGAFTGAQYSRKGRFEMADGGTIFLDEIGNISPKIQMELLRVIEDKRFYRVGGNKEITADFRVIAATNVNLEEAIEKGTFREDLFYRLNVFNIKIPALRDRKQDIIPLANHFFNLYKNSMNKNIGGIHEDAQNVLIEHPWPGNVRELENAIERAVVVCQSSEIRASDLPIEISNSDLKPFDSSLSIVQKKHIKKVLDQAGWQVSKAASILQIDRVTLYNKIKKFNIERDD